MLADLSAKHPTLAPDLAVLGAQLESEHRVHHRRAAAATASAEHRAAEVAELNFTVRVLAEELGLDPAAPFESRAAFLDRLAAALDALIRQARTLRAVDAGLERALRDAHALAADAFGDTAIRRHAVAAAVARAQALFARAEACTIADGSGSGPGAAPPKQQSAKKSKKPSAKRAKTQAFSGTGGGPNPGGATAQTGRAESGSQASSGWLECARAASPASSSVGASTVPRGAFFSGFPRESVRPPTANPKPVDVSGGFGVGSGSGGSGGVGFGASPSSSAFAAIRFGPGSTIPYSTTAAGSIYNSASALAGAGSPFASTAQLGARGASATGLGGEGSGSGGRARGGGEDSVSDGDEGEEE